ncbi:MAG: 23S rRNA (pseudouridine(1915)-N(3))-methyltransferase RlmH [Patescibacteria group bacterium]
MTPKIQIRCVGTLSEPWQRQAIHMYVERYRPFGSIEILEVPEGHKGSSKPDLAKTLKAEAQSLLKNLPSNTFLIALDQTGQGLTSEDLARLLNGSHPQFVIGNLSFVIVIGGSWGLDETVKKQANLTISLGKITLPHSLARIVLLEQLYRAQTIIHGKKYHK